MIHEFPLALSLATTHCWFIGRCVRFVTDGDQTAVTWLMHGDKNMLAKAMHMMVNMDRMVGGMFEQGLRQLKTVSEGTTS